MQALLETGFDGSHAKEKAEEMLSYFRLPENLWDIYPNTFSGGERLRLNLAHTMVKKPRLMLLDEPTASLDNKSKVLVKDMLLKLKQEDTSMIGIFHDLEFMDGLCGIALNNSKKPHRRSAYKQKAVRFFCALHWKMSILYPTNPHKKYTNQRGSFYPFRQLTDHAGYGKLTIEEGIHQKAPNTQKTNSAVVHSYK